MSARLPDVEQAVQVCASAAQFNFEKATLHTHLLAPYMQVWPPCSAAALFCQLVHPMGSPRASHFIFRALAALALAALAPAASYAQASRKAVQVKTAEGLAEALNSGAAHVHITQHLDLRSLPSRPVAGCSDCPPALFVGKTLVNLVSLTVRTL